MVLAQQCNVVRHVQEAGGGGGGLAGKNPPQPTKQGQDCAGPFGKATLQEESNLFGEPEYRKGSCDCCCCIIHHTHERLFLHISFVKDDPADLVGVANESNSITSRIQYSIFTPPTYDAQCGRTR